MSSDRQPRLRSFPVLTRPWACAPLFLLVACATGACVALPSVSPALPSASARQPGVTPVSTLPSISKLLHAGAISALAWSPNGKTIASTAGGLRSKDVRIVITPLSGPTITLTGETQPVSSLAWSPDGHLLASSSLDGTVRLWNEAGQTTDVLDPGSPRTGRFSWGTTQPLLSVAWSPDGRFLAAGGVDFGTAPQSGPSTVISGIVRIWRRDGALMRTLTTSRTGGKFLNVAWSPNGSLLVAGAVDYGLWRADGSLVARFSPGASPVSGFAWSPDGRQLAFGDENGNLSTFDTLGKSSGEISGLQPIFNLGFSPDGKALVVSGERLELRKLTDLARPQILLSRLLGAPPVWSDDGFLAAAADPVIWNDQGQPVEALGGCPDIQTLAWSPDGALLAGGSETGWMCVWRVHQHA